MSHALIVGLISEITVSVWQHLHSQCFGHSDFVAKPGNWTQTVKHLCNICYFGEQPIKRRFFFKDSSEQHLVSSWNCIELALFIISSAVGSCFVFGFLI